MYATDSPERFFGDSNRKLRRRLTTEELIWEAPYLRNITVTLFTLDPEVGDTLEISTSRDGEEWSELHYSTELHGKSAAGWHYVKAVGSAEAPHEVRYVRVRLKESHVAHDAIQLGEVVLEGG